MHDIVCMQAIIATYVPSILYVTRGILAKGSWPGSEVSPSMTEPALWNSDSHVPPPAVQSVLVYLET